MIQVGVPFTRTIISKNLTRNLSFKGDSYNSRLPSVEIVIDRLARKGWLTYLTIRSYARGKGQISFEFRFDENETPYLPQSKPLTRMLRKYMQELQRFVGQKSFEKPVGYTRQRWGFIKPTNVLGYCGISDFSFRLEVDFDTNHKSGESFVLAALRIYGSYLDAFKIPRDRGRPDSFDHQTHVMVKTEGSDKKYEVPITEYFLDQEGF